MIPCPREAKKSLRNQNYPSPSVICYFPRERHAASKPTTRACRVNFERVAKPLNATGKLEGKVNTDVIITVLENRRNRQKRCDLVNES